VEIVCHLVWISVGCVGLGVLVLLLMGCWSGWGIAFGLLGEGVLYLSSRIIGIIPNITVSWLLRLFYWPILYSRITFTIFGYIIALTQILIRRSYRLSIGTIQDHKW
jgi:hypothetical protein